MLDKTIRVRVSPLQSQKLDDYCNAWKLSRSELIRELIDGLPDDLSSLPRHHLEVITMSAKS